MTAKGSAYREDKAPTLRRSLETDARDGDSVPQMQPAPSPQRVRSQPTALTAPDLLHLQRTIGNQATQRLLARTSVLPPATQAVVQRGRGKPPAKQSTTGSGGARTGSAPDFIQPNDWKRTPQEIWKTYTPDKDTGAKFLDHLAQKSGSADTIDTSRLTTHPYDKLAAWLNGIFDAFTLGTHFFYGSTLFHGNDEKRYPVSENKQRYIEYGIVGTGQTRVVVDLETDRVYLSTHYERPKILLVNGAVPQAVLTQAKADLAGYK